MRSKERYLNACAKARVDATSHERMALESTTIPLIPRRKRDGKLLTKQEQGVYYNWLLGILKKSVAALLAEDEAP